MSNARATWNGLAMANEPIEASKQIQRAWDTPIITAAYNEILARCELPVDQARLKALTTPHAGDWLYAPPITAVGHRLSDEAIRVMRGFRLGTIVCQPHICVCDTMVVARGLHSLACRKSAPRHIRHSRLNDLIWRAIKKAQIPASKEPIGLSRSDGKRPDEATLVPWSRGKPLAWNVTVPDTYDASHIQATAISAGAAAEKASDKKRVKYNDLATTHIFVPIAMETSGSWCSQSAQFIEDLGRRITGVTNEPLETSYLHQRLSVSFQRGNAVAFNNTFKET